MKYCYGFVPFKLRVEILNPTPNISEYDCV